MSSRSTNVPASEGFLISNMKKDKLQFVKSLEPNASSDPQEDKWEVGNKNKLFSSWNKKELSTMKRLCPQWIHSQLLGGLDAHQF